MQITDGTKMLCVCAEAGLRIGEIQLFLTAEWISTAPNGIYIYVFPESVMDKLLTYETGRTYLIKLKVTVESGSHLFKIVSKPVKIKVTQSKVTLTAVPSTATFRAESDNALDVMLYTQTTIDGTKKYIKIDSERCQLQETTQFDIAASSSQKDGNGTSILVKPIENSKSKLVRNKSYKIKLITPFTDAAANSKQQAVTVTIKVMK